MSDDLQPKDHNERIAIFRAQMVGALVCRDLQRGELGPLLHELSQQRVRPPGSEVTRTFAVPTLKRWYQRYRKQGIDGLRLISRKRGYGCNLPDDKRQLILEIRRQHPHVSVTVLLRTLIAQGQLAPNDVSPGTVRRLLYAHGLDRQTLRQQSGDKNRRARWEAESPGVLWHADVCYGPALRSDGRNVPLRIHAILDDASRYVVAIQACDNERELEMLMLLVKALRCAGAPKVLYLDNGSTYSGDALAAVCASLGITLCHAQPYDPQARGKMERFWRTLREGCLDHIGHAGSLHDVQVRLLAFLDAYYHRAPHAGLLGESPEGRWQTKTHAAGTTELLGEKRLCAALTVRGRRRIKRDGTLMVGGVVWEAEQGFLAGRNVTVARTLLEPKQAPWVEHDGKTYMLRQVDVIANAKRQRRETTKPKPGIDAAPFDPAGALLRKMLHPTSKDNQR